MATAGDEPAAVGVLRAAVLRAVDAGTPLRELARRSGVPAGVLSRFARAERGVTLAVAAKLFAAVGLELVAAKNGRKASG